MCRMGSFHGALQADRQGAVEILDHLYRMEIFVVSDFHDCLIVVVGSTTRESVAFLENESRPDILLHFAE